MTLYTPTDLYRITLPTPGAVQSFQYRVEAEAEVDSSGYTESLVLEGTISSVSELHAAVELLQSSEKQLSEKYPQFSITMSSTEVQDLASTQERLASWKQQLEEISKREAIQLEARQIRWDAMRRTNASRMSPAEFEAWITENPRPGEDPEQAPIWERYNLPRPAPVMVRVPEVTVSIL